MEEYSDVNNAVLEQLSTKPDSAPSDVIKVVCEKLGMKREKVPVTVTGKRANRVW